MDPRWRYALIQLPELVLVGLALTAAHVYGWIGLASAAVLSGVWVAKELALYPLYRRALMEGPPAGAAALVDHDGQAVTPLEPSGQIRIRGEYWRARLAGGGYAAPGTTVRVVAADGLVLTVREAMASTSACGDVGLER
jgi:membrane protein implicated in regulation of membrane protease activity